MSLPSKLLTRASASPGGVGPVVQQSRDEPTHEGAPSLTRTGVVDTVASPLVGPGVAFGWKGWLIAGALVALVATLLLLLPGPWLVFLLSFVVGTGFWILHEAHLDEFYEVTRVQAKAADDGGQSRSIESRTTELPVEIQQQLLRIGKIVDDALPRLVRGDQSEDLRTMREAEALLVPEVVSEYLGLPQEFRDHEPLLNGKTAAQNTLEQLVTLADELELIQHRVLHAQSHAVLARGSYLHARFPGDPVAEALQLADTRSNGETLEHVAPATSGAADGSARSREKG